MKINRRDIYLDCNNHPVLCTGTEFDDGVEGISLIDGSGPRSCSIKHCAPVKIDLKTAMEIVDHVYKTGQRGKDGGWINYVSLSEELIRKIWYPTKIKEHE